VRCWFPQLASYPSCLTRRQLRSAVSKRAVRYRTLHYFVYLRLRLQNAWYHPRHIHHAFEKKGVKLSCYLTGLKPRRSNVRGFMCFWIASTRTDVRHDMYVNLASRKQNQAAFPTAGSSEAILRAVHKSLNPRNHLHLSYDLSSARITR
jgi:hypothetical protein